jgi:hypothetical protein
MKNKKIYVYIALALIAVATLCSCGVDKKCPAYSQVATSTI